MLAKREINRLPRGWEICTWLRPQGVGTSGGPDNIRRLKRLEISLIEIIPREKTTDVLKKKKKNECRELFIIRVYDNKEDEKSTCLRRLVKLIMVH